MDSLILRIRISRALERRALREVRTRLRRRREQIPNYPSLWREVIAKRALAMSHADYLRFRLLHRQFNGQPTPFLPSAVRMARAVVRRMPSLRRRLEN